MRRLEEVPIPRAVWNLRETLVCPAVIRSRPRYRERFTSHFTGRMDPRRDMIARFACRVPG